MKIDNPNMRIMHWNTQRNSSAVCHGWPGLGVNLELDLFLGGFPLPENKDTQYYRTPCNRR